MKVSDNGSTRRERRHFSAAQKAAIVKAHLVDKVPISDLCDKHDIVPNQFYQWQKQLFEGAAAAFDRKPGKPAGPSSAERKVEQLQAKLATKNEVISELMEENVRLKKTDGLL
jgi:transposase-like protein